MLLWICEIMRLTWLKPTYFLFSRCAARFQVTSEAPFLVPNQLIINNNKKGIIRPEVNLHCHCRTCHWIHICFPSTSIANRFSLILTGGEYSAVIAALFRGFAAGMDHGAHLIQVLIDGVQNTISCSHGLLIHVLLTGSLSFAGECGLQVPALARVKLSGYHWKQNAFSKPPSPVICFRVCFLKAFIF